jgi:hypothetical protein
MQVHSLVLLVYTVPYVSNRDLRTLTRVYAPYNAVFANALANAGRKHDEGQPLEIVDNQELAMLDAFEREDSEHFQKFVVENGTYYVLAQACWNNHMHIAVSLVKMVDLTSRHMRCSCNTAFRYTCKYGYLHILKWLKRTFQLTLSDASHSPGSCAMIHACKNGHLHVAKWLNDEFSFSVHRRWMVRYYLMHACFEGHLHVARWLKVTFELTPKEVQQFRGADILKSTERGGHIHVGAWLKDALGLG